MESDGVLDDIKSRLDIVEVISDSVALKRAGQNYKGLCPFHQEKTPSFMVSPQKQIFHCFGCGAGGDIFGFVMKHESLSFREALRLLANRAGIQLKSYGTGSGDRDSIKAMQKEAMGFYVETLNRSGTAKAYLKDRELTEETQRSFSLGYAPPGWHQLYDRLKAKGFKDPLILQSGLVAAGNKGAYDIFRARIMFPIFDIHGGVIAFGGRVMDEAQPKYLNSPDTVLFKKGEALFALDRAKDGIRKTGYVIVVEGYLDTILCHQNGIGNVVAPLGTALTAGHLRRLGRFTDRLVVVFDGDEAGVAAAKRSLPLILEHGLRAKILLLPEQEDPDSILRARGPEYLRELLESVSSPVDFILKSSNAEKVDTIKEAIEIISKVKDPILRDEFIMELSDRTGTRELTIREGLKGLKRDLKPVRNRPAATLPYNEEHLLLSAVIHAPEKAEKILEKLRIEDMKDSMVREILGRIRSIKGRLNPDSLLGVAETDDERGLISRLSLQPGFDTSVVDKNIDDCIKKITKRQIDEKIREAEKSGDLKLLNCLLTERQQLIRGIG